MKVTYSRASKRVYIAFADETIPVRESAEAKEVVLDFDANGKLLGIDASAFDFPREFLENAQCVID